MTELNNKVYFEGLTCELCIIHIVVYREWNIESYYILLLFPTNFMVFMKNFVIIISHF